MASTPPTQTGPRLTITGTCEGCAWLRISAGTRLCARWSVRDVIGYTYTPDVTPAWCPELPAARLALARSVVAEAQPLALPLPGDALVNPKPVSWDDGERR